MKYARKVLVGAEFRLLDVVEIPNPLPSWAADAPAFLAKQFPTLNNWFVLNEDVGNGAVEQGNGSFVQPVVVKTRPITATRDQAADHILAVLGGIARRGEVLKALKASTIATAVDIVDQLATRQRFTKAEIKAILQFCRNNDLPSADTTPANPARKIEAAEIASSDALWPEV